MRTLALSLKRVICWCSLRPRSRRADTGTTTGCRSKKPQADLDQAKADADRARGLTGSGALSSQQITEYLITERKAKAELASAKAALASAQLTLDRTKVYAVDDGVISERAASLGDVVTAGDEIFKLIRQNRIEWKAEVPFNRLHKCQSGHESSHPDAFRRCAGRGPGGFADDVDRQWSRDCLCDAASRKRNAVTQDRHPGQWLF